MRCLAHLALLASVLSAPGTALADPLAASSLPAPTRWVLHVDVDAARLASPLWEFARTRLVEPRKTDILPRLAVAERILRMKLPGELHDASLYGTTFDDAHVCIRIHGVMDKSNIVSFLRNDAEFQQTDHAGHDVVRWRDQGRDRLMYAGFEARQSDVPVNSWVILATDLNTLHAALDAMDGKANLKPESHLAPQPETPGATVEPPLLWLAAEGLSDLPRLQNVESPILSQMDAASISLRWTREQLRVDTRVQAKSEKTAEQLKAVAEGAKAFIALSAADDQAPPALRLLSRAMDQMNVQTQGALVKGDWSIGLDQVDVLLKLAEQAPENKAAPAPVINKLP